ncbi:MAG: hypothetical protein ACK51L_02295 [bacterium]
MDDDRCNRCKAKDRRKCYHHQVCDSVHVHTLLQDLESQLGLYYERHGKRYHDIISRSRLLTNHMQGNKEGDELHIDYEVPPFDDEKKNNTRTLLLVSVLSEGLGLI